MKALSHDPARRWADAAEMLGALEDVPVLEELASTRALARDDAADTMLAIAVTPSLPRRIWSWLRFGAWRWPSPRDSGGPAR